MSILAPITRIALLCALATACTTQLNGGESGGDTGDKLDDLGADAGTEPIPDTPDAQAEPERPTGDPVTLQGATSNEITPQNSISCNNGSPNFLHTENHYYRSYPLQAHGVVSDFYVTSVDVGIEEAAAQAGVQPITVSLFTEDGTLQQPVLTPLGSTNLNVNNQTLSVLNVPIEAQVPAGSTLIVEVMTPNGSSAGNRFFIGSNRGGETQSTFISSPDPACNTPIPTPISQLGIGGLIMSVVLNVNGEQLAP